MPDVVSSLGLNVSPLRYESSSAHNASTASDRDINVDIDFTILSYDVGHEKPHPAIFDAARETFLQTRSQAPGHEIGNDGEELEMLHVGDDLVKDVQGAMQAGWRSVLVDREGLYSGVESVRRIAGLEELRNWKP